MMRSLVMSVAAGAALAMVGSAALAAPAPLSIPLTAQNGSGEHGTATLTDAGGGAVSVKLTLAGGAAGAQQPAHIHKGTCSNLDPKPTYALATVKNGASQTIVKGLTVAALRKGTYAINVHKSVMALPVYVACGNIPKA